ncbi:MAG: hypothetical protein AAF664_00340, partial [Planctomycetota bacterium]
DLEFEKAASLRDRVLQLRENIGKPLQEVEEERTGNSSPQRGKRRKGRRRGNTSRSQIPRPKKP